MNQPVDFLIFAPLDEEVQALKEAFGIANEAPEFMADGSECYHHVVAVDHGHASVMLVRLKHMGVLGAAVMATKLIPERKPWCVVSFGIAGGFVGEDVAKRDVIVPSDVFYYEPAKETMAAEAKPGGEAAHHERESRVRIFVTSREIEVICRRVKLAAEKELGVRCIVGGPLASGEKKIADLDGPTVNAVKKIHGRPLAVEMEAAGVAAAVEGWPEARPRCHLLVVKGISDDASALENLKNAERVENRRAAARNAARFLFRVVESAQAERPPELPNLHLSELRGTAEALIRAVPSFAMSVVPDAAEVMRVLHPRENPPPIFYHWRIRHPAMHWVDFVHLLLIQRIHKTVAEFPIHLLITERAPDGDGRASTERVVQAMFDGKATVSWYGEVVQHRGEYIGYAEKLGFDWSVLRTVRYSHHILGVEEGNLISEEWLQYVIWITRQTSRAIFLIWNRMGTIYQQLMNVLPHQYLLLRGEDFVLGGTPGKFGEPGSGLLIEPPGYAVLLEWLAMERETTRIVDMVRYLSLEGSDWPAVDESLLESATFALTNAHPTLRAAWMERMPDEGQGARNDMLRVLARWNVRWFGNP